MPVDEFLPETPQNRLAEALRDNNKRYLEDYDRGRGDAEDGNDRNESDNVAYTDGYDSAPLRDLTDEGTGGAGRPKLGEAEEYDGPPVMISFHPLGGVAVTVRQLDGKAAQARITVEQAWTTAGHLNALAAMLLQAAYAQAMTPANAQDLYVKRS